MKAGGTGGGTDAGGTDTGRGIALMCLTMLLFAFQDTLSKRLVAEYSVFFVTAVRYGFMAVVAVALAARESGGLRATVRTRRAPAQIVRGLLLALQICIVVSSFVLLGIIETHAILAATPLMIVALSGPVLGERVGWRRRVAIGIGFVGVLVILDPGSGVVSPWALVSVGACAVFTAYSLLTRSVARDDGPATSFFWTAAVGLVVLAPVGVWFSEPMGLEDAAVMALLCVTAGTGHFLLIRTYAIAEANVVQPFSYLQLVFATVLAVAFFGERPEGHVVAGAAVVVAAGVFTLVRTGRKARR